MPIYELAAVGAATCWAVSGLLSAPPAAHLGALAFNRTRQIFVAVVLALYVLMTGTWQALSLDVVRPLLLSGFIGIFVGDTLLFTCLNRLGPRRAGILFAMNAPMAALLGWAVLGESLSGTAVIGIGLTVFGVTLAILLGRRRGPRRRRLHSRSAAATIAEPNSARLIAIVAATGPKSQDNVPVTRRLACPR